MITMKKKVIVNTAVIVVFLAVVAGCAAFLSKPKTDNDANTKDNWTKIQQEKVITIGLDDTFVPMGFRDSSGKLEGFDIDLADKVFSDLGIKVNWQPIDWSMKETELNTGNIDAIWNGYTKTPARAKQVAFSQVYHKVALSVVVKKGQGINKFADMSGKILGVQTGSSGESSLNDQPKVLKQYIKGQKPIEYDTFDKAFTDLNANRIDGLLVDEDYARYYIKHQANPADYEILKGGFPETEDVVGFRKGDVELKAAVNRELTKLTKNGFVSALENKWFAQN
ncbi:amino acid ABC transporter substrate-binding protein [Fructobacillus americanaquae]|uniref:Amino acid ABC transporter substrate-binding protein n=1 Tax=Fructobacillus americanaquae TaxID=2940302 RepID=A0ABY5C587_9LACO|nr:amino acid ABC transporter substrate-binding protein [Fructobacillus americanaquae]USS92446.1 amino acid ABC transporter substrate-binding protein [Fructobacillus americanaquae]